jgi:hypothetical protein
LACMAFGWLLDGSRKRSLGQTAEGARNRPARWGNSEPPRRWLQPRKCA